jgi:hypothetical protein
MIYLEHPTVGVDISMMPGRRMLLAIATAPRRRGLCGTAQALTRAECPH